MLPTDSEIIDQALAEAADWGEPRCRFVESMLRLPGLAYADPETRDAYVKEVFLEGIDFPGGAPTEAQIQQAYAMAASMSACGIVTSRVWRDAGVNAPYTRKFYGNRIGSAVGAEMEFAKAHKAWVSGLPWRRGTPFPEAGDALIIGDNTPAMKRGDVTAYQHELNALCWIDGGRGGLLASVDGGQPGIAIRTRGLVEVFPDGGDEGEIWCGSVAKDGSIPLGGDGRPANGRRCIGWTNVAKLPFRSDAPSCKGGALSTLGRVLLSTLGALLVVGGTLQATGKVDFRRLL
jgi:hypothetical protein